MWQAVESSIQTFNKTRRLTMNFRRSTKSNVLFGIRREGDDEKLRIMLFFFRIENTPAIHPISRPTCSIAELMKKTKFSKEEIRHLYRTFKQVNSLIRLTFFLHFSISIGQSIRSSKQRTFCFHLRNIISNGRYVYTYTYFLSLTK